MCKHVINAQTYIQSPCCGKWYECSECHDEANKDHTFQHSPQLRFTCKTCRKVFSRDFKIFSKRDQYCDFCEIRWCLPAETPESKIFKESNAVLQDSMHGLLDSQNNYFHSI